MSHHPNVERLLDGTDWRLLRDEEAERVNAVYERTHRAWIARNEGEANAQMQQFKPLYNTPEPEPEKKILTPLRVLIWCGAALAACVAGFSTLLYFYR